MSAPSTAESTSRGAGSIAGSYALSEGSSPRAGDSSSVASFLTPVQSVDLGASGNEASPIRRCVLQP